LGAAFFWESLNNIAAGVSLQLGAVPQKAKAFPYSAATACTGSVMDSSVSG